MPFFLEGLPMIAPLLRLVPLAFLLPLTLAFVGVPAPSLGQHGTSVVVPVLVQPPQSISAQIMNADPLGDGYSDVKTTYYSNKHDCVEVEYRLVRAGVVVETKPGFTVCGGPPLQGLQVERVTFAGPQPGDQVEVHATFTAASGGTANEYAIAGTL